MRDIARRGMSRRVLDEYDAEFFNPNEKRRFYRVVENVQVRRVYLVDATSTRQAEKRILGGPGSRTAGAVIGREGSDVRERIVKSLGAIREREAGRAA